MKTITLSFDADKMTIDSANGSFNVSVNVDERDLNSILQQIGISNILSGLQDELLDEIGADTCCEHFDLIPNAE